MKPNQRKNKYKDNLDLYETPSIATKCIIDELLLPLDSKIWEPADGMGAISNVLQDAGYTDIKRSDIRSGTDFFDCVDQPIYDVIMTNPPYTYAQEFIEKSLRQVREGGYVVMLLRLSFLESMKRREFFKCTGLYHLYVSCRRISMYPYGKPQATAGFVSYAWYVWKIGYTGEPKLGWINYG